MATSAGGGRPLPGGVWRPNAHDRYQLTGPTGCGKTYLAKALSASFAAVPPWLVLWIDPKSERSLRAIPPIELTEIGTAQGVRRLTIPPFVGAAEEAFAAVWARRIGPEGEAYCLVVVDELPMVATEQKPGTYLRWLYGQGRSREIGAIGLMQDPVRVPVMCKTQSEHHLTWRLRNPDYIADVARGCGQDPASFARHMTLLGPHECLLHSDALPDLARLRVA